jgi:hypothetical protein
LARKQLVIPEKNTCATDRETVPFVLLKPSGWRVEPGWGFERRVLDMLSYDNLSRTYLSFATTVSQLKICDFSGETFKEFEVLKFSISSTTTQLLSGGEFCKLRYDTVPVKSASANVSFYTNNSKMPNFDL